MLLTEDSEDGLSCISNESRKHASTFLSPVNQKNSSVTTVSSCYEVTWHLSTAPDWCCNIWHTQYLSLSTSSSPCLFTKSCLIIGMFVPFLLSELLFSLPAIWFLSSTVSLIIQLSFSFHLCFSFIISLHFSTPPVFWSHIIHASIQRWSLFCFPFYLLSSHLPGRKPMPSSDASPLFLSSTILFLNFLSYIYLWSLSSSPLCTSDPSFPNFAVLWSLHSPELCGMSLCVSCLCRSLHVWWPWGRDDTALLEWKGTESGRSSTNALLNPLQYTMSSS